MGRQMFRLMLALVILCGSFGALARMADIGESDSSASPTSGWQSFVKSQVSKVEVTVTGWLARGRALLSDQSPKKVVGPLPSKNAPQLPAANRSQEQIGNVESASQNPEIKAKLAELPVFSDSSKREIGKAYREVAKTAPIGVVTAAPARVGTSQLPTSKSGVPKFEFVQRQEKVNKKGVKSSVEIKIKDIPALDIGDEEKISAKSLMLPQSDLSTRKYPVVSPLQSPAPFDAKIVKSWTTAPISPVQVFKDLDRKGLGLGEIVTLNKIEKVKWKIAETSAVNEFPHAELTAGELRMLTALILAKDSDNCSGVMGLFFEALSNPDVKDEAQYFLARCSRDLKLESEALEAYLTSVRAKEEAFGKKAFMDLLALGIPWESEIKSAKVLQSSEVEKYHSLDQKGDIYYILGKAQYREEKEKLAMATLEKVGKKSAHRYEARFLSSIVKYNQGQVQDSILELTQLFKDVSTRGNRDKNLESLISINLGRMLFAQQKYKDSVEAFVKIPKDHPLWVTALVEQGWAQILNGDTAGAIGNMYSLHSPYFKNVFMPDSFVVRSVGYLNICQYADAYKSLTHLEKTYRPWAAMVEQYIKSRSGPLDYYATVRTFLRNRGQGDADGLPGAVIREVARQRDFLSYQDAINRRVDEQSQWEKSQQQLIVIKDKIRGKVGASQQRIAELKRRRTQIVSLKNSNIAADYTAIDTEIATLEERIISLKYRVGIYENAKTQFAQLRLKAEARIEKEKDQLKELGGKALLKHTQRVREQLAKVLENNEFLRYEVFAGSGENIRYQVAGGATKGENRVPASVRPEKMVNWDFEGEYWEDEIGSYRSTLRDNCPVSGAVSIGKSGPALPN